MWPTVVVTPITFLGQNVGRREIDDAAKGRSITDNGVDRFSFNHA